MADQKTQAPASPSPAAAAPPAGAITVTESKAAAKPSAVVDNPAPAPATGPGPMELLMTLVDGLVDIAQAEGSQGKPSAKPWGDLKRKLEAILDDMGMRVAPAPASSLRAPTPAAKRHQPVNRMQMRSPYGARKPIAPTRAPRVR